MAKKKFLFVTGDVTDDYETVAPFQVLKTAGHTVHTICHGKKKGDKVFTALYDFLDVLNLPRVCRL
jgi:protease I